MGNEILLMDGVSYQPWTPPDETALAKIIEEDAKDIFGEDCLYFGDLKKRIKSAAGAGSIPDGWAVILGVPIQAYPVEIELASHDVWGHISPQIDKIRAALQNPVTQQQIVGAIYDEITKDGVLNARAKAKIGSNDLHKLLSDAISSQAQQLLIVIDSASPQLRECAANKSVPPGIVEFATFRRQGAEAVHIHQFEPLFTGEPPPPPPPLGVATAKDFIHQGNGIYVYSRNPAVILDVKKKMREVRRQLASGGLSTRARTFHAFYWSLRKRAGLLNTPTQD